MRLDAALVHRLEQRTLPLAGEGAERFQRRLADAALGRGDGAAGRPGRRPRWRSGAGRRTMSLISARSKKLWPPETWCTESRSRRSAFSNTRAWWLPRYRIAKSENLARALEAVRRQPGCAHARSASCSSSSHCHAPASASPSPMLAPQLLLEQLRVVARSRRWRRCRMRAGRAVVLLQLDHLQRREIGRQASSGFRWWRRASRRCLVVVAHRREQRALAGRPPAA